MSASHDRKHVDHCLNCGAATPGAFCSACGQEAIDAAVTFRDQLAHFFDEVFGVESRLPQTVKLLLLRPGALTRAYNDGQRVRFVTPLKLYLFASVAFFLVMSLSGSVSGGSPRIIRLSYTPDAPVGGSVTPSQEQWKSAEDFDEWLKEPKNAATIPAFLQPHFRSFLKSPETFMSSLFDTLSKASMALVPIHALLLKLLYWRPRRLYGEHIVFSLHLHSFAYVIFAVAGLVGLAGHGLGNALGTLAFVGGGIYSVAAARRAYAEGVMRSALKMTAAGVGYAIALVSVVTLASGITFMLT